MVIFNLFLFLAYKSESFTKIALKKFSPTDTTPEMFPEVSLVSLFYNNFHDDTFARKRSAPVP